MPRPPTAFTDSLQTSFSMTESHRRSNGSVFGAFTDAYISIYAQNATLALTFGPFAGSERSMHHLDQIRLQFQSERGKCEGTERSVCVCVRYSTDECHELDKLTVSLFVSEDLIMTDAIEQIRHTHTHPTDISEAIDSQTGTPKETKTGLSMFF